MADLLTWLSENYVAPFLPHFQALGVRVLTDFALVTADDVSAMGMAPVDCMRVLAAAKAGFPAVSLLPSVHWWLSRTFEQDYVPAFEKLGVRAFDDLSFISLDDLKAMGMSVVECRRVLSAAKARLPASSLLSEFDVEAWLNLNFVGNFLPQFQALGVARLSDLALVTADDLKPMNLLPVDCRRVLAAAKAGFPESYPLLQLEAWLASNYIHAYLPSFKALGVEGMSDLALVTEDDLKAIGLSPIDCRRVLSSAAAGFPSAHTFPDLQTWLRGNFVAGYLQHFRTLGVRVQTDLSLVTADDLEGMGMPVVHVRRILTAARRNFPAGAHFLAAPSSAPFPAPNDAPFPAPNAPPNSAPSGLPDASPCDTATTAPSGEDAAAPSREDVATPSGEDAAPIDLTDSPQADPTDSPQEDPTDSPQADPTDSPQADPTDSPQADPTDSPQADPTDSPQAKRRRRHPPVSVDGEGDGDSLSKKEDVGGPRLKAIRGCQRSGSADAFIGPEEEPPAAASAIAVLASRLLVVTGRDDGRFSLWRADDGSHVRDFEDEKGDQVNCIASSLDDNMVVSGHCDGCALVWNATLWKCELALVGHSEPVVGAAISADKTRIVTVDWEGQLRFWDAAGSGTALWSLETGIDYSESMYGGAISADGAYFLWAAGARMCESKKVKLVGAKLVGLESESVIFESENQDWDELLKDMTAPTENNGEKAVWTPTLWRFSTVFQNGRLELPAPESADSSESWRISTSAEPDGGQSTGKLLSLACALRAADGGAISEPLSACVHADIISIAAGWMPAGADGRRQAVVACELKGTAAPAVLHIIPAKETKAICEMETISLLERLSPVEPVERTERDQPNSEMGTISLLRKPSPVPKPSPVEPVERTERDQA